MLRVAVDLDVCQGHGECCRLAPDLFELDDDLVLTWAVQPDDQRRADVEEAAAMCPTGAITVVRP